MDNQRLELALRIRADLREALTELNRLGGGLDDVSHRAEASGHELNNLSRSVSGVVAGFVGFQALGGLVEMVDQYGQMADRIQMATRDTAEYDLVQKRLLDTANRTFRPLAEAQELYITTADALRSLNYSTEDSLDITDSFSYLLVTNAASADRAANAVGAYSKAIQTGKVDQDSWRSILLAMPTIVEALATATGKTTDEIRALGIQGKLSVQDLNEGLRKTVEANRQAADGMGTTVADAMVRMRTNLAAYLGEANRATEVTATMAAAISYVSEHVDTLAGLVGVAMVGAFARYVSQLVISAQASAAATLATRARVLEELRLAQAQAAGTAATLAQTRVNLGLTASHAQVAAAEAAHAVATQRLAAAQAAAGVAARGVLGLLGGPAGIIALVASAAASFLLFRDNAKESQVVLDAMALSAEQFASKWEKASTSMRRGMLEALKKKLAEAKDAANDSMVDIEKALYGMAKKGEVPITDVMSAMQQLRAAAEEGGVGIDDAVQSIAGMEKVSKDSKSQLNILGGQLSENTQKALDLGNETANYTAELDGNTAALKRNALAAAGGSEAATKRLAAIRSEVAALRLKRADQLDPSAQGRAGRHLVELGPDASDDEKRQYQEELLSKYALEDGIEAHNQKNRQTRQGGKKGRSDAERAAKQTDDYVKGLERQAAQLGMTSAQTREAELAEKHLTGTLEQRARAALAVMEADDKRRQAEENAKVNAGLEADYLRASGRDLDAALLELRTRTEEQRKAFEKAGNDAGLAWLNKLVPVAESKARVEEVQRQLDTLLERQRQAEQSLNVQQDAGLLTKIEAREKLLELHKATAAELAKLRPQLESMAALPGEVGETARRALAELDNQATELLTTASLLQSTLRDGFASGLNSAVDGLIKRTMSLRDAIAAVADSVRDALLHVATDNIAQYASKGLMDALGLGGDDSGAAIEAASAQGAAAMNAGITAGGTAAAAEMAASITAAGAAAAAAIAAAKGAAVPSGGMQGIVDGAVATMTGDTPLSFDQAAQAVAAASSQGADAMGAAITTATSSGGGTLASALEGAFGSGADLFGGLFSSLFSSLLGGSSGGGGGGWASAIGSAFSAYVGAATGGHINGPGTGTSDSIPAWLSDGEFVTRAAVVDQPGALAFLHDFNTQGMSALDAWALRVRHATGGVAGIPAPAAPAPSLGAGQPAEPTARGGGDAQLNARFVLVDDRQKIPEAMQSAEGEKAFMVVASRNVPTLRQMLGVPS